MSKRASLALVLAITTAGTRLSAQDPTPPTRIAVIRVHEVYQNYAKVIEGRKALDAAIAPYRKLQEKLKTDADRLQTQASDGTLDANAKANATTQLTAVRRQMEDLQIEAKKVVGNKSEQMMIDMYRELESAIAQYAEQHQIDLVLAHAEARKEDRLKFPSVNSKFNAVQQGGAVPFFVRPRLDITQAVLQNLNDAYAAKK